MTLHRQRDRQRIATIAYHQKNSAPDRFRIVTTFEASVFLEVRNLAEKNGWPMARQIRDLVSKGLGK